MHEEHRLQQKLHLGCGKRFLRGFIHVDIEPHPNVQHVRNIGDLSIFTSGSVDEIYCSHAFEYFDRKEAGGILKEWFRVLKNEGKIFMTVPNFSALVKIYENTGSIDSVIGPIMGRWENPKNGEVIFHKTIWDLDSLSQAISDAGFSLIAEFNPIEYLADLDPNYDDYSLAFYPHMNRRGIQVSLALSALKRI